MEKRFFSPLTSILAIFSFYLLLPKKPLGFISLIIALSSMGIFPSVFPYKPINWSWHIRDFFPPFLPPFPLLLLQNLLTSLFSHFQDQFSSFIYFNNL
ncbi:unnamed protein product [Meloidogyne enterolobii]|uniref:Uncharacterized protein n=2 Tax=Meloidogyne enterolobii TaxID=390850 RepID=A0A6V7Y9T9_MELEN|nr:unnamed protein product [Meloidogyne enterolobii]